MFQYAIIVGLIFAVEAAACILAVVYKSDVSITSGQTRDTVCGTHQER